MPPGNQTRTIIIKADSRGAPGLKEIADRLGGITKNTRDMAKGFENLGAASATFLGGLSVRTLVTYSDEIQNLNNKLLSMTGSQEKATDTLRQLTQIARDTNQSLDGISQGYFRLNLALQDAGVSQGTLLDITKTVANTFRLSGASAIEAANATVQLGQAFSLGVLRGQDLRSVMSQNVVIAKLLRREFGNDLLKAAEKGLITIPKFLKIIRDNMETVNSQAKLMSATFEQSLVKALDAFKLKVFEVSSSLGLQSAFAIGIQWAIDHIGQLSFVLTVFAVSTMPLLLRQIYALAAALGLLNPWVVGLTAIAAGLAVLDDGIKDNATILERFEHGALNAADALLQLDKSMSKELAEHSTGLKGYIGQLTQKFLDMTGIVDTVHDKLNELENPPKGSLVELFETAHAATARWAKDLDKVGKFFKKDLTAKEQLERLNAQFLAGSISVSEYNKKILETQVSMSKWKFKEGEEDLGKLNDVTRKFEMFKVNQQFKDGALNVEQFHQAINKIKLANLKEDLEAGRISLEDFNSKLASVSDEFSTKGAFRTGLQDYILAIGTTTQQVADLIKDSFTKLEDYFVQFIKTGKFNFAKFTQDILDDLTRIIVRAAIVQPLAAGLLSALPSTAAASGPPGGGGGQYAVPNAMGNVYDSGLKKFAGGGVVSSPTMFGFGKGKAGLMGEAGPEAILPLARGSGGKLGVEASVTPVTINIINNSSGQVEKTETTGPNGEKQIEILITNKVREGVMNGKFDKVMSQSYGLNRKGV